MAMSADARAEAIYASILASNPRSARMSPAEKSAMRDGIQKVFGADLAYIQGAAEVPGAQYSAPSTACTVATSTGPASGTTVAATVAGVGKVF